VLLDPFNCLGRYSDAPKDGCAELRFLDRREPARLSGAYKTPTLREVGRTAPYFHDGSLATLEDVVAHYRRPPADPGSEIVPLELSDPEAAQLAAFLRALSGGVAADPAWLAPPGATVAGPGAGGG
jgi:cytochrome c peroxidase